VEGEAGTSPTKIIIYFVNIEIKKFPLELKNSKILCIGVRDKNSRFDIKLFKGVVLCTYIEL
jgi:hypothetical protein